ncbi:hypothetical protein PR202_ga02432 [Eleusine coracana subsp. coracana]|uniref:Phosphatidic acid phosphatase type 2/haloperoxidase domain-containing protein n=1 Tax=Eleusine coracana subsp. coracana TaxID=191504 RepID=A0AAV5BJR4_ELECO|nr:hypothetical protein PR202_ga02432 [Eleusine coracana subsp. coracana]
MWLFLGAIANRLLSKILKKTLNYERPTQALRSDPGMPSSHAQSIFYAATILVLSCKDYIKLVILTRWLQLIKLSLCSSAVLVTGLTGSSYAKSGHCRSCCRIYIQYHMVYALAFARAGGTPFFTVAPECSSPWISSILRWLRHSSLAQGSVVVLHGCNGRLFNRH